jgi:hypothetical protein
MSDALAEIQQSITAGVAASGATWEGSAADAARFALAPLGDWAEQAAMAADTMRMSTELQGNLLGKARSDMPPPMPVTAEQPDGAVTTIAHLFGFQTDYEIQESSSNAAEQKAFQVMAEYEAGTTENTSTLGDFGTPPPLEVDTSAITAAGPPKAREPHESYRRSRVRVGRSSRSSAKSESESRASADIEEPRTTSPVRTSASEPAPADVDVPASRSGVAPEPESDESFVDSFFVDAEEALGGERRVSPRVIGE